MKTTIPGKKKKPTIPDMKRYINWISGRLDTVEEMINYLEDITIKSAQNETQ